MRLLKVGVSIIVLLLAMIIIVPIASAEKYNPGYNCVYNNRSYREPYPR